MELVSPDLSVRQRRHILDGVRLGMESHGTAEDIVVYPAFARIPSSSGLKCLIEQARLAHAEMDGMLSSILTIPMSAAWLDAVHMLRLRAEAHAAREEHDLLPMLRAALSPDLYRSLAGAFATERLKQLSMMQPSAPIAVALEALR